jgi:hypothetical protein
VLPGGVGRVGRARLLDHLVRAQQQCLRDSQAQRLGGPEVDDQLECGRLLDRKVCGLGALEDFVDIDCSASKELRRPWSIRYEAPETTNSRASNIAGKRAALAVRAIAVRSAKVKGVMMTTSPS